VQTIRLRIQQLLLDTQNPRIGTASSQHEALQKVLDDQGEKLFELASSIAVDGMSPIDRLLVLRENKNSHRYVALEGNRRVAALKILDNPAVLTGLNVRSSLQKRLEELAENFDKAKIEPVDCSEAETRQAAASWLHLRHTGENEGRGVVGWSGQASARFRGTEPALQAFDFVKTHGNLTEHQKRALENRFPITNLDRLLSAPDVRQRIGVEVRNGKLYSDLPPDELIKPLRRIILDLASKTVRVGQLMKKKQQIEYINGLNKKDRPKLAKRNEMRPIEEIRETEFKTKPAQVKDRARRTDPSERKVLVPRAANFVVTDNKTAEILRELKRLKIDEFPHAIAVLLRVFLELSVDYYMEKQKMPRFFVHPKGGNSLEKTLETKTKEVIADLSKNGAAQKKDFAAILREITDQKSPLFIKLLHDYVHNRFVTPKPRELLAAWNNAQHLFEGIWS
jgi:hypothetical protein